MVVTLKDIARQAGVSTTTVSRILNGRESGLPIREETRHKVLSIAAELGYKPNTLARRLRGSHSSLIGVLAQNVTSLFHSQILRGLNDAAVRRGYRVFLGHVQKQVNIALDYGSMFEQSHADGILIVGELEGDWEALEALTRQHRYVVGVSDRTSRRAYPGVYSDSVLGTHLAMEHLWTLGHRHIVCIYDPKLQDSRLRAETYQQFMQQHYPRERLKLIETSRSLAASCETGLDLFGDLGMYHYPTAIFAATDAIAIGLLQAAYQTNTAVPGQVSIVGFDDIDISAYTIPPLTTVRQAGFEMGRAAANLLLDMIEQERSGDDIEDVELEPTLVVRQSTAPPQT